MSMPEMFATQVDLLPTWLSERLLLQIDAGPSTFSPLRARSSEGHI